MADSRPQTPGGPGKDDWSLMAFCQQELTAGKPLQAALGNVAGVLLSAMPCSRVWFCGDIPDGKDLTAARDIAEKRLSGMPSLEASLVPDDFLQATVLPGLMERLNQREAVAVAGNDLTAAYASVRGPDLLLVPIFAGQCLWGVMGLEATTQADAWNPDRLRLLKHLAVSMGMAVELQQKDEALQAQFEFLQKLMDTMPYPVYIKDLKGFCIGCNRAFESYTGHPRDKILGRTMDELFPQSVADEFRRRDESLLQKPGAHAYEASIQHVDGNQHDVIFHKATFANMHGRVAGLMVAILDVTRENRLEEQLRHIQKMDAIGRLAGGISHDFNNLMAAIMVNTDMVLADIGESHPLRPDIEAVRRAADRAAALTRQLLAFSRKQVMYPKVLDLNTVVVDMHRILRRVIGENIDLVIEADDTLRPVKVDPVQIGQVVMNLAINARDAMPDGGRLEIKTQNYDFSDAEAAAYADLSPGPYVLLSVRDTGGGMDEHVRNHVFEPFFTTKEEGKGTGLGLATVYGIVRQSDGHIFVESEVGEGALFKIFLPETGDPATQDHVEPRQMHVRGGGETVLIAEDENMVRQPAAEVLRKYGYTVLEASDGVEALETVKNHQGEIHLLLSDAVMPRMNGAELASQVRALRPETRLVFMSGHPDNTLVRLGLDGDDILFIQKPFSMDELVHRVRRVLDGDVDSSSDL